MKKLIPGILYISLGGIFLLPVQANQFQMHGSGSNLIGEVEYVVAEERDTLLDIARRHGLGYEDMKLVNPEVDTWLPGQGQKIVLPSQFILPMAPQQGIVMNIPEMRLYYYLPAETGLPREVITYPIGIGREGWRTPYIKTNIIEKKSNPSWRPPESIRKEHAEKGDPLPEIVKPGPDNPLGDYAMRLGLPEYLIHGTNQPFGVGMRVSHGCIRLYPENIEALFSVVPLRTPVNIINQPYKVGIKNDVIYLEAHPYLAEDAAKFNNNLTSVISHIIDLSGDRDFEIDQAAAYAAISAPTGMPVAIGMYTSKIIQARADEKPALKTTPAGEANSGVHLDTKTKSK